MIILYADRNCGVAVLRGDFGGMRGIDLDDLVRGGVVGWTCCNAQEVLICHCMKSALSSRDIHEKGRKICSGRCMS